MQQSKTFLSSFAFIVLVLSTFSNVSFAGTPFQVLECHSTNTAVNEYSISVRQNFDDSNIEVTDLEAVVFEKAGTSWSQVGVFPVTFLQPNGNNGSTSYKQPTGSFDLTLHSEATSVENGSTSIRLTSERNAIGNRTLSLIDAYFGFFLRDWGIPIPMSPTAIQRKRVDVDSDSRAFSAPVPDEVKRKNNRRRCLGFVLNYRHQSVVEGHSASSWKQMSDSDPSELPLPVK